MMQSSSSVNGRDGLRGTIESVDESHLRVRFDDGESVVLPVNLLRRDEGDEPSVPIGSPREKPEENQNHSERVVPVVEEQIDVRKRVRETERVAIHVVPHEREEVVDVSLDDEQVDVQRVEVNRFVDAPPPVRQEGDVTIIPVMEEVLVVTKRLRVKHELRMTRRRQTRREQRRVTLKTEEAHVLRSPAQPD